MMYVNDSIGDCYNGNEICRVSSKQYISLRSKSRSHIAQAYRSIIAGLPTERSAQSHISLFIIMSSGDDFRSYSGVQSDRIVESRRSVMIAHDATSNKDCFLRNAAAKAFNLSKLGSVSGNKYGAPLSDPVSVCGFERALLDV